MSRQQQRSVSPISNSSKLQQSQQLNQYQLNPPLMKQLQQLPLQQSQSDDQDILQKIDSLLLQNQPQLIINNSDNNNNDQQLNSKSSQRQMLLNFKVTELQKIINNLNQANKKLKSQLEEYYLNNQQQQQSRYNHNTNNYNNNKHNNNDSSNNILNSSTSESPFNDELTEMHGEFQQIEHLIGQYKEQLAAAEKKWNALRQQKDQEIESLKNQLIRVTESKEVLEQEIQSVLMQNEQLRTKNQQLLIDVDSLQLQLQRNQQQQYSQPQPQTYMLPPSQYPPQQTRYYQTPLKHNQFQDYRFNEKIKFQMQSMIKKLLNQLSNQKRVNSQMKIEIKRLSNEVVELQRTIKVKNDAIYQLEMRTIQMEKYLHDHQRGSYNVTANRNNNFVGIRNATLTSVSSKPQSKQYYTSNNKYTPRINQQQLKLQFRSKQEQLWLQNQNQTNQYTDESDRSNNYDDNAFTSVPIKTSRNPQSTKPQQFITNLSSNTNNNNNYNFIKPKRTPQQTAKLSNSNNNSPLSPNQLNDNSINKQFISFSLMQLQAGKIKITMKQKILIISRVIDLYCKKIKGQSYQNLIAEDIQVYNFNDKYPNLVRVRVNNGDSKGDITTGIVQQEDSEEKLMYNLAFIVQSIVKEVQIVDRQDLQVDLNLTEVIEEILAKNMQEKISYFQQLSKSLENSVITLG